MLKDYKIVLATNNAHKVGEFEKLFFYHLGKEVKIYTLKEIGFEGDIVENGRTFSENALIKASAVAGEGIVAIADDSGLCVDALDGAPGIYSARYAGTGNDRDNNNKLLDELKGVSYRDASFVCALACIFPESSGIDPFVCKGVCRGEILLSERGKGGFGYDPLFWVDSKGKTFAELTGDEKNVISHRGDAVNVLIGELRRIGQID